MPVPTSFDVIVILEKTLSEVIICGAACGGNKKGTACRKASSPSVRYIQLAARSYLNTEDSQLYFATGEAPFHVM